jgi:hypothetical protein
MRPLLSLLAPALLFAQPPPTGAEIHATAQCESVNSNVLGINSLQTCNIGVTNYSANTFTISEPMVREWFPALQIENAQRAQAVGDKVFNSSKKSRAIAAFNFLSPLAVAFMGGGLIHASVEAIAAVSLANTAAQNFKDYLIGQQPNEAAFLPTLPATFTLTPYGTPTFSVEYTVLGSINYVSGPGALPMIRSSGSEQRGIIQGAKGRTTLIWNGNLPVTRPELPPIVTPAVPLPTSLGISNTGTFTDVALDLARDRGLNAANTAALERDLRRAEGSGVSFEARVPEYLAFAK